MPSQVPFAILAPVPEEHLRSALLPSMTTAPYIGFGTNKWELLRQVDHMRNGLPVPVLIYPSHEGAPFNGRVEWFGWYHGHVFANAAGRHPQGSAVRPPTTVSDGRWAAFWNVTGLRFLEAASRMPIGKIQGMKGGWRKDAPPHGPELVTLPTLLSNQP